jgi:N4-gp56 family major capsid protein
MALPTIAGNTNATDASYPSVFYDRTGVMELQSHLQLYPAIEKKQMPDRSGVAMQIFGYTKLAATSTVATDGQPSATGAVLTASTGTLSLGQWVDYASYSDKSVLTGISDVVVEGSRMLGYRGALTVDTSINVAVDAVAAASTASRINLATGSYFSAAIARKAAAQLRSVDVKTKSNGLYYGVISSLMSFDLINDANAGGYQDAFRYIDPKQLQKDTDQSTGRVAVLGGIEWWESNTLPVTANFASTGVNGYRAYVFGQDAFFGASLGKTNLGQRNFSVQQARFDQGTNALDPAGQIRAASFYNFFFGVAARPQGVPAFRRITAESSIG